MSISNLLIKLNNLNVQVNIKNDKLDLIAPKGVLNQELIKEVTDNKIFLINYLNNQKQQKELSGSINHAEKKEYYKTTPGQKRMYLLQQQDIQSVAYNMSGILPLPKKTDSKFIQQIFEKIITRHDCFNTSFEIVDDIIVQNINKKREVKIEECRIDEEDIEIIKWNLTKPFDLSIAPLLRVKLITNSADEKLLFLDMHHIISDGTTVNILKNEFTSLLDREELKQLPTGYIDYSEWYNSKDHQNRIRQQEEFWVNKFSDEWSILNLPADFTRKKIKTHDGSNINFYLNAEEFDCIKYICNKFNTTLYMSILAAYNVFLSKISGQEDVIIGTAIDGRRHYNLGSIAGMFVNTLVFRNNLAPTITIRKYIEKLKNEVVEVFKNQEYPFDVLVDILSIKRNTSNNPIFDVGFNFHGKDEQSKQFSSLENIDKHVKSISKFDLLLTAREFDDLLLLNFEYSTNLFKESTINHFIRYFKIVINQLKNNLDNTISEIEIISEEEKLKILNEFNKPINFTSNKNTVIELFEEQVKKNPYTIACEYNDLKVTYNELNKRSDEIAGMLLKEGVKTEDIVAILLDRSINMIISLLGIIKVGAAYLPLDINYPLNRMQFILDDSNAYILITKKEYINELHINRVLLIEEEISIKCKKDYKHNLTKSENLLYVIYTSGSTGNPKGVLIENLGCINLIKAHKNIFKNNKDSRMSQVANPSFDAMSFEVWPCLTSGANLCIVNDEIQKDPFMMKQWLIRNHINISYQTTLMTEQLLNYEWNEKYLSLKALRAAGDRFRKNLIKNYPFKVYNLYGPTEDTIWTTYAELSANSSQSITPIIGKPIENKRIYIVNSKGCLLPVGIVGELCISGVGLAREYLNKKELTEKCFIPNLFDDTGRLYKTGDLARWLPDGNIEFIDRKDNQVKIRGYRIELGEIEINLLTHPEINEAIVIDKKNNDEDKYLCAYYTSHREFQFNELREYLLKNLPEYMIPLYFVQMKSMPLTQSGKVNKSKLPEPQIKFLEEYLAPRDRKEFIIVDIFQEVLNIEKIGINDNFFTIGGDSIKVIQIVSKLKNRGFDVSSKNIFEFPTVQELARMINVLEINDEQSIVEGEVSLIPIQHYFFSNEVDQHHYNQSVMLYSEEQLDEGKIKEVFQKLQEHHDALRMICKCNEGKYSLYNKGIDNFPVSLNIYNLKNETGAKEKLISYSNHIQRSIDIENGPLMKLGLFHLDDGDRLLIVIHHLVIDGVSWRIIFEDIESLYKQAKRGDKLTLPFKSISFMDWSNKLIKYAKSSKLLKEKSYWNEIGKQEIISLEKDIDDENFNNNDLDSMQFILDETTTNNLLTKTNQAYGTAINDILLCGLGYGIKKTFGNEKVIIFLEGHGREDIFPNTNLSRTIGWFTSLYPVLLDMKYKHNLSMQLKFVKESLHQIPEKGIGYGVLKYLTPLELKENIKFDNKHQIEFNYLGQFDSDLKQMSQFSVTQEYSGETESLNREINYNFSFTGIIAEGKLTISVNYKKKYYSKKRISNLLDNYKKSLIDIINHCKNLPQKILTPSDFTYKKLTLDQVDKLCAEFNIDDIYKLTPLQEGILFHSLYNPSSSYVIQSLASLSGNLNIEGLKNSFDKILERYDVLRTVFVYENVDCPLQVVLKDCKIDFTYEDLTGINNVDQIESIIAKYKSNDQINVFDLSKDILMRVKVFKTGKQEYNLIWSFHHILMDGWCFRILINELSEIYQQLLFGKKNNLELPLQYKKHINWITNLDYDESKMFWDNYLNNFNDNSDFSLFKTLDSEVKVNKKGQKDLFLSEKNTNILKQISIKAQVTLNTLFHTIWGLMLAKLNDKTDVIFGAIVSGRPAEIYGVESMVGLFINTIPVRIKFNLETRFIDFIKEVQSKAIECDKHHHFPLDKILQLRSSKESYFDHILGFQNYQHAENSDDLFNNPFNKDDKNKITVNQVEIYDPTHYDLDIRIFVDDKLGVSFRYNKNAYSESFIVRLEEFLIKIFDQIIENENIILGDIKLSTEIVDVDSTFPDSDFEF